MVKFGQVSRATKKPLVRPASSSRDAQRICAVTKVAVFDFFTFSETNLVLLVNLTGFSA